MHLADTFSVWELCDIVKDSAFSTISSSAASKPEIQPTTQTSEEVAESEVDDGEILEDIRTFMTQEENEEENLGCSHLLRGFWQPDGGPGTAFNPQLQLVTGPLTLLQVELRAQVEANNTLELWLLGGTRWGETVKQLAPQDAEEDETQPGGEAEHPKGAGRFYRILTSAHSVSKHGGPLRVLLDCEVPRGETLTLLLARGSYMKDSEKSAQLEEAPNSPSRRPSVLHAESGRRLSSQILPPDAGLGRRRVSTQESLTKLDRKMSVSREGGDSPRSGRRASQSGKSSISLGRKSSVSLGRKSSISLGRRMSQTGELEELESGENSPSRRRQDRLGQVVLPALPVVVQDDEEPEMVKQSPKVEMATLVPDFLVPAPKAVVRGWSAEDDHFEVRIWTTSPLKKSPKALTEPPKPYEFDNSAWQGQVQSLKQTFEDLEEVHEESLWHLRADTAWHARVSLNEDLDKVQAELRRLQQTDVEHIDFFKYCRSYRQGGFMLLDCIGKELGIRERMGPGKKGVLRSRAVLSVSTW